MSTYIDSPAYWAPNVEEGGFRYEPGIDWRDHTRQRLEWLYGPERASAIMEGRDVQTNADLAAWSALGSRRAA